MKKMNAVLTQIDTLRKKKKPKAKITGDSNFNKGFGGPVSLARPKVVHSRGPLLRLNGGDATAGENFAERSGSPLRDEDEQRQQRAARKTFRMFLCASGAISDA